ncbi:MAG: hypothetical protein E6713_07985 [Sporomusaceae bacterium]|nr:hypothetical protein [Sporomusaceae bacterium]
MNQKAKKFIAFSLLAGIMQTGLFMSTSEASPGDEWRMRHDEAYTQEDRRHNEAMQRWSFESRSHWRERQREERERHERFMERFHERERQHDLEMARHEREMARRDHESWRAWKDRQELEEQRHNEAVHNIAAFLIGLAVGSASNG